MVTPVADLDHFNWGGQSGASCTVRGASYIKTLFLSYYFLHCTARGYFREEKT